MKFIVVTLLVCLSAHGFASVENQETIEALDTSPTNVITRILDLFRGVLNNAVIRLIESQREDVATGWPPHVPPLDPFFLEEFLIVPEEVGGFSSLQMTLNDSYIRGLQQFKVEEVDIRPLRMSAKVALSFEQLEMEGVHATQATILQGLFPLTLTGSGPYNMTFRDVKVSVFAQIGMRRGRLNLNILLLDFTIGSTTTNFTGFGPLQDPLFNSVASAAFPAIMLLKKIELNLRIYEEIIPAINERLNQITVLDLFAVIFDFFQDDGLNTIRDAIRNAVLGWVCNSRSEDNFSPFKPL